MRAVLLNGYGGVDQLEYTEVPAPVAKAGEVQVHVISTSINPVDFKLREGKLKEIMPLNLPAILGRDVAGEVTQVGESVTEFAIGDKVMGLVNASYAEYLTTSAANLTRIPAGLDTIHAGVLPLVALTAAQLIESGVRPRSGGTVLVLGALGSVGRVAVYVAKQHGAHVVAGVRANQAKDAESLGADLVLAVDDDKQIAHLPQLDAIADTVGGPTLAKVISKLKKHGTLATVVGKTVDVDESIQVNQVWAHPDPARLHTLAEELRDGKFDIPIGNRMKLSDIRRAHTLAEAGGHGKIAILPLG